MAQINLLKQNTDGGVFKQFSPKILVQVLAGVLIILLGYYGFLFFQSKSTDNKIGETQRQIENYRQDALNVPNKEELFVRQQQIKSLKELIGGHLYWSQIFKPLAEVTLKNAKYSSIKVTSANSINLNVKVPSLADLDKYTQVFNLPEINKNFSNIRIGSYSKSQNATSTSIQFSVQMDYNPQLLIYQSPAFLGK